MQRFASSRWLFFGLIVGVSAVAESASAVDPKILTELYHQGLKSFYAGDNTQAHELLTQAIEAGGNDPRYYYFRGIANLRLKRDANAKLDFAKGAELEGREVTSFYNVSTALARVQGAERRTLEEYRGAGRQQAVAAMEKLRFDSFRRFNSAESIAGSTSTPADPSAASAGATTPAAAANPFGAPAANPFGAPAAPTTPEAAPAATPPAGGNPFGAAAPAAPAAMPAAAPATPAAPAPGNNPFGVPAPAAPAPNNNPFGVPVPGAAPAAAPTAPAPAGTNPFGV